MLYLSDSHNCYLFHLIVPLNPVFNFPKSLLSFSADKVTTGTCSFVSFILKFAFLRLLIPASGSASGSASLVALLVITQFLGQVRVKDTSQLINGMSSVLQKLLKNFKGTAISTSTFSTLLPSNFPLILVL